MKERLCPGDTAVDATIGNGHDTLFLCRLTGVAGHVYGTDIQPEAVANTRARLQSGGIEESRFTLWQADHARLSELLPPQVHGSVAAVMFNLGYLPGGDHGTVTAADTTITALTAAIGTLRPGGVITAVVYPGHPGGGEEAEAVANWAAALPQDRYQSLQYRFMNQRNAPPYVIAVEKRG